MNATITLEAMELQALPIALAGSPVRSKSSLEPLRNAVPPTSSAQLSTTGEPRTLVPSNPKSTSNLRIALTILQPSLINFFSSFSNGVTIIGLPVIARSIALPRSLYLWPSSVWGLSSGAMLLIAGSVADIVGYRRVELTGIFLLGAFTIACGSSRTGVQLVIFRALQGVAMAMHLPASVALVAAGVPQGKARNVGFACLGMSQPLGFSFGLVVSGVLIERLGWRSGYFVSGGAMLVAAVAAIWMLPNAKPARHISTGTVLLNKLATEIDWVGGVLAGGGLALLAYVLAVLSAELFSVRSATTIVLLSISVVLLGAFPFWMHYRERAGKPALVPNSLWKSHPFTSTCIMVSLSYGTMGSIELFSSLYFQEVQLKSTLAASFYLLPNLITAVCINVVMGIFVHRLPARLLVTASSLLCAMCPLIMALVNPKLNYWLLEFWAQVLAPTSPDVLFTVGLIIVSDSFPEETQALAGAVFSTLGQFGQSLGVGICQVVALSVMSKGTGQSGADGDAFETADVDELLQGYRASFWTMFGYMLVCGLIAPIGLRKAGKVGLKRE